MVTQKKQDYSVGYIRKLLACYDKLSEGKWPFDDGGNIPTYENAIIAKADLDRAIDSLDDIGKEVVIKLHIEGYPLTDLESKFENVGQIERQAARNMAACLNGECVLERWCGENGMVAKGNVCVPNYLPREIQQYIRDICLKYCVLEECPE